MHIKSTARSARAPLYDFLYKEFKVSFDTRQRAEFKKMLEVLDDAQLNDLNARIKELERINVSLRVKPAQKPRPFGARPQNGNHPLLAPYHKGKGVRDYQSKYTNPDSWKM